MPLNLNNATYKSFTDFASNVNGRTIAAFGDDTTSVQGGGSLGGRTIVPSHNRDFIGNVRRNTSKQEANNAVRKLFRQSIIDMFGGESMIPESVKTAMKLEDYGKGKPLSARRIMAVKVAIDAVKAEMQPVKIDDAKARQMVDQSENMLGFALGDPEDASKASQLLMKYGDGLPGKSAQVLSNFIVNSMIRAGDPSVEFDEDILRDFADDLKTWDEFSLGDLPDEFDFEGITVGRKYVEDLWNYDARDHISGFEKPVLILHGSEDDVVPPSYSKEASKLYPNCTFFLISGAEHGFSGRYIGEAGDLALDFIFKNI